MELVSTNKAECPFCGSKGVLYCDIVVGEYVDIHSKYVTCVLMCRKCGTKFGFGQHLDGSPLREGGDISWFNDSIKPAVKEKE